MSNGDDDTKKPAKLPESSEVQAFDIPEADIIPDEKPDLTSQEVNKKVSIPKKKE